MRTRQPPVDVFIPIVLIASGIGSLSLFAFLAACTVSQNGVNEDRQRMEAIDAPPMEATVLPAVGTGDSSVRRVVLQVIEGDESDANSCAVTPDWSQEKYLRICSERPTPLAGEDCSLFLSQAFVSGDTTVSPDFTGCGD